MEYLHPQNKHKGTKQNVMVQLRKQGLTHTRKHPHLNFRSLLLFRKPRKTERFVAITKIVCLLREGNNSELFQTTYNLTKNPAVQCLLIGSIGGEVELGDAQDRTLRRKEVHLKQPPSQVRLLIINQYNQDPFNPNYSRGKVGCAFRGINKRVVATVNTLILQQRVSRNCCSGRKLFNFLYGSVLLLNK